MPFLGKTPFVPKDNSVSTSMLINDAVTAAKVAYGAGGTHIQTVQGTYAGSVQTTTSDSWSDTGLTVNITPTATTSKFLVHVGAQIGGQRDDGSTYSGDYRIIEDGVTNNYFPTTAAGFGYMHTNDTSNSYTHYINGFLNGMWLHDPTLSDLSALTYTCQMSGHSTFTAKFNYAGTDATAVITVTELAG